MVAAEKVEFDDGSHTCSLFVSSVLLPLAYSMASTTLGGRERESGGWHLSCEGAQSRSYVCLFLVHGTEVTTSTAPKKVKKKGSSKKVKSAATGTRTQGNEVGSP